MPPVWLRLTGRVRHRGNGVKLLEQHFGGAGGQQVLMAADQHQGGGGHELLAAGRRLGLGLDLVEFDQHHPRIDRTRFVRGDRRGRRDAGEAHRDDRGQRHGLPGWYRGLDGGVGIGGVGVGIGVGIGVRRLGSNTARASGCSSKAAVARRCWAVSNSAPSWCTTLSTVLRAIRSSLVGAVAEVGLTAARGVSQHLVADRVAQASREGDLLWRVPGGVGGDRRRGRRRDGRRGCGSMVSVPNGVTKV